MKKNETAAVSEKVLLYLKIARIMKLTTALLLFVCLQVSASGWSQDRITLKMNEAEIKKVLFAIEKKSNYRFLFSEEAIKGKPRVNVDVVEAPLASVLDMILANTGVGYKILGTNLVVLKEGSAIEIVSQEVRVTGKVTSSAGEVLVGVSVSVKGTRAGTTTDGSGNFSITVPDDATLVFSNIGYETKEVAVGRQTSLSVTLEPAIKIQEQVIVVGYGSQRKIDVTGSVSTVKGEDISKQASINPISALQGKVAGVQITNSGAPGSSPTIRIRGVGTIYGSASPLYVVDGVWFDDVSFLNPADIENISILKDASSEAIYGIRAANGVVLIATKKGRSGQAVVNYNGSVGYQKVTNQIEMANAGEYAQLINELNNGTQVLNPADYANTKGTDWYHQILRNALITNHQVSLNGGSEKVTYNLSLGYLKQEGIVKKNDYERYTARLQNDFNIAKPLKIGYTVTGAYSFSNDNNGNIFHQLYSAYPVLPVYYADGTYGDPGDYPLGDGAKFNPQANIDLFNQTTKRYRATGNIYADLKFAKHFTFHTSIGGEYNDADVTNYTPVFIKYPDGQVVSATFKNTLSRLSVTKDHVRNWIFENTLTYENKINDHNFKVLLGQSAQSYRYTKTIETAENVPVTTDGNYYFALGNNYRLVDVDISNTSLPAFPLYSTVASYFGRLNYSFRNRYLLTATMRADGSSKFSGNDRWGYFPSVGAGWIISDEAFMQNQKTFSNLKLRASWGKIGNVSVPGNLSTQKVTTDAILTAIFNGVAFPGASINTIVPPAIAWERGVGTDIGLEAVLMHNKLSLDVDYYIKKTENAIFAIPVLGSLGLGGGSQLIGNQADYENRGIEFAATWKDAIKSNLSYSISGNLGFNKNKVLNVSTGANPIYQAVGTTGSNNFNTRTVVGRPIGEFFGYVVDGIFQTNAEATSSLQGASGAVAGDFKYRDISGPAGKPDGAINDFDKVPIGNPNPKVTYGINTNWNYKEFDLTVDFQGVAGVDIYNANLGLRYGSENFTKDFFDNRFHGQGTSNDYPSARIGGGQNYLANSFYVEDGSYLRIRNLQLGYTLASSMTTKWKIKRLRVYVDAQNPFNFFKYKGFSPEIGGGPTRAGVDVDVYPLSATYRFGVNVTL
jgi:TonB-linked SusC/RagA family outer membrane protein